MQAIYSAHLKLHPLLVLAVLVVAEHSLGVWGLLLAGACFPTTLRYLSTYGLLRFVAEWPSIACFWTFGLSTSLCR